MLFYSPGKVRKHKVEREKLKEGKDPGGRKSSKEIKERGVSVASAGVMENFVKREDKEKKEMKEKGSGERGKRRGRGLRRNNEHVKKNGRRVEKGIRKYEERIERD